MCGYILRVAYFKRWLQHWKCVHVVVAAVAEIVARDAVVLCLQLL